MPFREAHGVVAGLVRNAVDSGRGLSELRSEELAAHSELLAAHEKEFRGVLESGSWLEFEDLRGGDILGARGRAAEAGRADAR